MRNIFVVLGFLLLSGCDPKPVSGPDEHTDFLNALTYEGRVSLDMDASLYAVVSLKPSTNPGEGEYLLHEELESEEGVVTLSNLGGRYSLLPDENGDLVIHLHRSSLLTTVKRVFRNPGDSKLYEENFREKDLYLEQSDDLSFVRIVNPGSKRIAPENEPILVRKTSRSFTIEGYLTHMGDTARFEEINTGEMWPVSRLGNYLVATQQYHQLASEKYERIYLKGVGHAVVNFNAAAVPMGEALVIDKLLQMSSAPATEDQP